MRSYIIRRLLLMIPSLWIASLILFFAIRLIPGSIIDIMAAEMITFTDMDKAAIEQQLGLDQPAITQYIEWIGNIVLHFDFGDSLWGSGPVIEIIADKFPVTLELGFLGLLVSQLIAIPIGVYSALRQDTAGDYITRSYAILCVALPVFWVGTLIVIFPSIWWGWSPSLRLYTFAEDPLANLEMFIVPAVILGMSLAGITMRMTRNMMLEVLRQDYIRTAWAKGLSERVVVIRHALKNALIPIIITVGIQLGVLIGGTVVIEQIFGLPGMGRLLVDSVTLRDYTIITGVMLFFGLGMSLINLVVDLTYSFLDPRIRYD